MQQFLQWKAICITQTESVSVTFGTQHAMHMQHIVICDLPPHSTKFFHIIW